MTKVWINLTNGLQGITDYKLTDYRVMRLQSSHCEAKRWDLVMQSIPDELLYWLARQEDCFMIDYGARKDTPRSIWQGLEFLKFVLHHKWFERHYRLVGRAATAGHYFERECRKLSKRERNRLTYYRDFLCGPEVRLFGLSGPTEDDGEKQRMIKEHLNG